MKYRSWLFLLIFAALVLSFLSWRSINPTPENLLPRAGKFFKVSITDSLGKPLSVTYENNLNINDYVDLSQIPDLLQKAFVTAEDKRFYSHHGVDWKARLSAVLQNVKNLKVVRGASTITEQVVRIINPRPRSLWSRWLEGIEAILLERKFSKQEILEFYLNEVPYARKRRGIAQAARLYFDRDLDTLNAREMLTLAALVRAPGRMDLFNNKSLIEVAVRNLAQKLVQQGSINETQYDEIKSHQLQLQEALLVSDSGHFVRYVNANQIMPAATIKNGKLKTSIDGNLQSKITNVLRARIKDLSTHNVKNGAVLVIDHQQNKILSWVSASIDSTVDGAYIDAILTKRQPGSALKPFLYAQAFERGWTPATIVDDSDLKQAVGSGLHTYRNYSRIHYGPVRVRDVLGNSLNIPAIRTISYVGVANFLSFLRKLGFESLQQSSEYYGEGLALGNGEVTLFELVNAYSVLARGGRKEEVSFLPEHSSVEHQQIISEENATLIADILSDPYARRLEFGSAGVLDFPIQTAIKTGTSSDYRDVWAVGFSKTYTVGVWMGNLSREPMVNLTGSSGPALVLRSIFHELYRHRVGESLKRSKNLVSKRICSISGLLAAAACPHIDEHFKEGTTPFKTCDSTHAISNTERSAHDEPTIMVPTPGLRVAMDPRVPDDKEAMRFLLKSTSGVERVEWSIDGEFYSALSDHSYVWRLIKGKHAVYARVFLLNNPQVRQTAVVNFTVR